VAKRLRKELLETARGLYDLGAIGGKTMREFESLRVEAPKVYSAYEIKRLRLKEKASQAVFAVYLKHQRLDGAEVGNWREEAERRSVEAARSCRTQGVESA